MVFNGFHGDTELSMGYVLGVRGFKLDAMGRLTGWSFPTVWRPGQNEAICYRKSRVCRRSSASDHRHTNSCYKLDPCDGDIANCDHGFWGYFEQIDDQGRDIRTHGYQAIIKGFGRTVIGTKGFRAEKAEILAITVPKDYAAPAAPRALIARNYPNVLIFDNLREMFAAYPTQDETPSQPTDPRDPAFWDYDLSKAGYKVIRRVDTSTSAS